MSCVCCERKCDDTFRVHGYTVCFECTMNKSQAAIVAIIQEQLHLNVNTWSNLSPTT